MMFSRYCQYAFLLSFCSLRLVSLYWSVFFLHGCCFIFLEYLFLLVMRDFISLFTQGSLRLELFIIFVGIDWFIMSKTFSLKLFHSWSIQLDLVLSIAFLCLCFWVFLLFPLCLLCFIGILFLVVCLFFLV
jgi:hypothetical protein